MGADRRGAELGACCTFQQAPAPPFSSPRMVPRVEIRLSGLVGALAGCWPFLPPAFPASGGVQGRPVQLEEVVGDRHEVPLPERLFGSPQQETDQPTGRLDLPKHRLGDDLAQGIDGLAGFGADLAVHPASGIEIPWCGTS